MSMQRGARRVLRNLVQILRCPEQPKNEEPLAIGAEHGAASQRSITA